MQPLAFRNRSVHGPVVKVFVVGDTGLSGRVALTPGRDAYESLFIEVNLFVRMVDRVFVNLKYLLAAKVEPNKMFAGDSQAAFATRDAGFRLVHVANNDVGEYGVQGLLLDTRTLFAGEV